MKLVDAYQEFGRQCRRAPPGTVKDALALFRWLASAEIEPEDPEQALIFEMGSNPDDPAVVDVTLARDFWVDGEDLEQLGCGFVVPNQAAPAAESCLISGMPARWAPRAADQLGTEAFLAAVHQALDDRRLLDAPADRFFIF